MAPIVTVTTAVPREYIYPDHYNRQQSILTRSTPAYHAPVITAGITHPPLHQFPHAMGQSYYASTQTGHPVFATQQQTQNMVGQPWTTIGTPGATYQPPTVTRSSGQHAIYSHGAPAGASVGYTSVPTGNNSVRFNMADDIQTPQTPADNTERAENRVRQNAQHSSDNNSDHGSDDSNSSRQELAEARKAFRHVLQAPNQEKFAGDRKTYHLWEKSLRSEVEHIQMTSDMWIKLLQQRTESAAHDIVQENRRAQEMIGSAATLKLIWEAFHKRYATNRTPGWDILNDLMTGEVISESEPESYWKFVHQCTMMATAMEYSETVRATLSLPHSQETIAKRLGNKGFDEWEIHRQKRLKKNKIVTFQTFCEWIDTIAATLEARKSSRQTRSQELNPKANPFTARQSPSGRIFNNRHDLSLPRTRNGEQRNRYF